MCLDFEGEVYYMKRMERTEKVIGENTFYIVPFAAFTATNISAELSAVLSPMLGSTQTLALRTGRLSSQRRQSRSLARGSFSGRAERESCLRTRSKPAPDGACISTP